VASSAFDHLETVADLPWHVDPKDRFDMPEEHRQRAFINEARIVAPSLIIWAVPNAAKRTQWAAGKAKREGMVAGTPDLTVVWAGGCAFVEFKNGREMPSPNQRDMLNRLYRAGHHCGVFRTSASLLAWLQGLGAPVRVRKS